MFPKIIFGSTFFHFGKLVNEACTDNCRADKPDDRLGNDNAEISGFRNQEKGDGRFADHFHEASDERGDFDTDALQGASKNDQSNQEEIERKVPFQVSEALGNHFVVAASADAFYQEFTEGEGNKNGDEGNGEAKSKGGKNAAFDSLGFARTEVLACKGGRSHT